MLFGTENAELKILDWIQETFACDFMDFIMPKISVLGNAGILWIAITVFLLLSKRYRKTGVLMTAALLCCLFAVNIILKPMAARPRPCWINENSALLVANPTDCSFPSGHTAAAFVSAFIIMKNYRKTGTAVLVLACLIAFSRMYLYVHFPTDIIGGVLIAAVIYAVVTYIAQLRRIVSN